MPHDSGSSPENAGDARSPAKPGLAAAARGRVAVLRTDPRTVHDDLARLVALAGMSAALDPAAATIL